MTESPQGTLLVVLIAIVALVGIALGIASFTSQTSMWRMMGGGGMHGGNLTPADTPGGIEWTVLLASALFFAGAVVLLFRARGPRRAPVAAGPQLTTTPAVAAPHPGSQTPDPVPELTLVKLLDEDERRMYLELREHGGEMLQRDLVALGTFSKAKVTRVLDKLEAKGVVVRERRGMTNLVRIVARSSL